MAAVKAGIATRGFTQPGHPVADALCVARRTTPEGAGVDLGALMVEAA